MAQDLVYLFDKTTKLRSILGEIQSDFNIGLTIDGSKDSCSVIVHNFDGAEIEPYTILWHEKTNTWWVVSSDKVERYQNEQGFIYIHELELLGAIDLLNARDLTDCGFNDNTYTVFQFIDRLFKLSNFEIPMLFSSSISNNFLNKKVDFIKTFENYTLLSALREFLDAYNMCPKLSFDTHYVNNKIELHYARINIIPKTGDNSLHTHIIEDFDDARETKTMNKESFGTCVVSNAENVISSKEKMFPSVGSVRLSSTKLEVDGNSAVLRLPSKVFKGIWLKMLYPVDITMQISGYNYTTRFYPQNDTSFQKIINHYVTQVENILPSEQYETFINDFNSKLSIIKENLNKAATVTFYEGNKLVPTFSSNSSTLVIEKGDDVPYLTKLSIGHNNKVNFIFTDKETKEMLPNTKQGIAWERGSNLITGFQYIDVMEGFNYDTVYPEDTDYQSDESSIYELHIGSGLGENTLSITLPMEIRVLKKNISFIVKYFPMTDIKIKVDNQRDKKDIQLYNQNGRLTDTFALSKLLNSYSKEISSDNIVRYMQYTNFNDIPKVGSFVLKGNDTYVINNVSMTFTQNESRLANDFCYFIDCEFNMSKAVSTKSLMVNPNSNIRDYGIPQNFNVKRKQLYRDYYELNYSTNDDTETNYYLDIENIFNFGHYPNQLDDFIAVIKLHYDNPIGGNTDMGINASSTWYYQLETTKYYMNKMLYIVLDFNDNNIIGYGSQNIFSGFNVSRIFDDLTDTINTPISYVDDDGRVRGITIKFATSDAITSVYNDYQGEEEYEGDLYNYSVFIPQDIYDDVEETFIIDEELYNKDALEVPVFEYACQIDDSYDVLIGDNILTQRNGNIKYFYSFVKGHNLTQDNAVQTNRVTESISPLGWTLSNGATIEYERFTNAIRLLRARIYTTQFLDLNDGSWNDQNQLTFEEGYDYAFFRHAYDFTTKEETIDLLFIAKAVPYTHISNDGKTLTLEINHYKLN